MRTVLSNFIKVIVGIYPNFKIRIPRACLSHFKWLNKAKQIASIFSASLGYKVNLMLYLEKLLNKL